MQSICWRGVVMCRDRRLPSTRCRRSHRWPIWMRCRAPLLVERRLPRRLTLPLRLRQTNKTREAPVWWRRRPLSRLKSTGNVMRSVTFVTVFLSLIRLPLLSENGETLTRRGIQWAKCVGRVGREKLPKCILLVFVFGVLRYDILIDCGPFAAVYQCPTFQHSSIFDPLLGVSWWFRDARSTHCPRAYSVAGHSLWNSLPDSLRDPDLGRDNFRRLLKTHLFTLYLEMFQDDMLNKLTYLLTYLNFWSKRPQIMMMSEQMPVFDPKPLNRLFWYTSLVYSLLNGCWILILNHWIVIR